VGGFSGLLLVLLAILVTGCGGGSEGTAEEATGASGGSAPVVTDPAPAIEPRTVTLDHGGFRLLYDCDRRVALRFEYRLEADAGQLARADTFLLNDPLLPPGCAEQLRAGSYGSVAPGWDRGHLVAANHMDGSAEWMNAAFYMTNIVPQRAALNRGIWLQTEEIAECYRDLAPVQVIGGLLFDDTTNDLFLNSHGLRTPDWFWKVLITTDARGALQAQAWLMPNRDGLGDLDAHLVRLVDLEARVGALRLGLPELPEALRTAQPMRSWSLPAGCQLG
jgi:endonuclease G